MSCGWTARSTRSSTCTRVVRDLRHRLTATFGRSRRILDRRLLDGRLPEPTARLLRELIRLEVTHRLRRARARFVASIRLDVGTPLRRSTSGTWRAWTTTGELGVPLAEYGHLLATEVVTEFERADLAPFLVARSDEHLHFGLMADRRRDALAVLAALGESSTWYLRWRRGHRWHLSRPNSLLTRRATRAECWHVFRCASMGPELVAGPEQAVEISFWTPGSSGRHERLGHRGLERFDPAAAVTVETVDGHAYPGSSAFPVGRSLVELNEPVDVVYTWVDGDDPTWRTEFEHWKHIDDPDRRGDHAAHASRYASRDELRYSLRSLWSNAGWVRHVYIVTADQVPDWLHQDDRLTVVPHHSIFPHEWLPTFNSHAIESRLHHIDGLAEHFVYLNDDMFLGRQVAPGRFFTPNGLSRFFESGARVPTVATGSPDLAVDTAARRGQRLIEDAFGVTVTHKLHHAPYALRRSVMFEVEERFREVVEATSRQRFRHPDDLSIPSAFAHHYGFCTGRAVPGDLHVGYENLGSRRLGLFLRRALLGRDFDAFCINETETWESDPARAAASVRSFLARYFPVPSPWERPSAGS